MQEKGAKCFKMFQPLFFLYFYLNGDKLASIAELKAIFNPASNLQARQKCLLAAGDIGHGSVFAGHSSESWLIPAVASENKIAHHGLIARVHSCRRAATVATVIVTKPG